MGLAQELSIQIQQMSVDLTQVWDPSGFNTLHYAAYKNSTTMVQVLCSYAKRQEESNMERLQQEGQQQQSYRSQNIKLAQWINQPASGDESFTAMHFAAFNGNVEMMQYLIRMGADIDLIHRQSKSQVSIFHVAAQGDSPSSLAFLKKELENIDPNIINKRDIRMATPLHWACYSGAENAVQYLLAWDADVNAQDQSGITPLHNAVKNAEEIKSARSVRLLLIKGALRNLKDSYGRTPIEIARECKIHNVRKEVLSYLEEPNFMQKCMIQTPMQKVQRSTVSVQMFIYLFLFSFFYLSAFIFPGIIVYHLILRIDPNVSRLLKGSLILCFVIASIFFLFSWLTDPGFLEPSKDIDFLSIIPKFDPSNLCPECELIKTKRCRHCNICNRCVERYDHHCPWINNCVGYKNHGYFYIYIASLQVYMLLVFYIIVVELRRRIQSIISLQTFRQMGLLDALALALRGSSSIQTMNYQNLYFNIFSISLLLICVIFLIPLIILVCVQTKNMMSNETTSERFSRKKDQSQQATGQDLTPADIVLQHGSSQYQDSIYDKQNIQRRSYPGNMDYINQIAENCFKMSCAINEFERQEDLLERKYKQNSNV